MGCCPATGPTLKTALCHILTLVGRWINTALQCKIQFHQSCMHNKVVPDYILRHISRIKCCNTMWNVLFIKDETVFFFFFLESIIPIETCLQILWKKSWMSLSFFDIIGFSQYLFSDGSNTQNKILFKNRSFLHFLMRRKFGCVVTSDRHIFNFSLFCWIVKNWCCQEN